MGGTGCRSQKGRGGSRRPARRVVDHVQVWWTVGARGQSKGGAAARDVTPAARLTGAFTAYKTGHEVFGLEKIKEM